MTNTVALAQSAPEQCDYVTSLINFVVA